VASKPSPADRAAGARGPHARDQKQAGPSCREAARWAEKKEVGLRPFCTVDSMIFLFFFRSHFSISLVYFLSLFHFEPTE
jgi:hypothetical protein